jgi:D,D-heptose 1,7-bisphosphate phosphatase
LNNVKPQKTIFLDRDGVINKCAAPHCYVSKWEDFKFLPGAIDGIKLLNEAGYLTLLISNQRGIALNLYSLKDVDMLHEKMCKCLADYGAHIDGIYICPHDNGECDCRKPAIGLYRKAEKDWMINKEKSYCIGDMESDIKAGNSYGIKTILIGDKKQDYRQDLTFSSLKEASAYLVNKEEE